MSKNKNSSKFVLQKLNNFIDIVGTHNPFYGQFITNVG